MISRVFFVLALLMAGCSKDEVPQNISFGTLSVENQCSPCLTVGKVEETYIPGLQVYIDLIDFCNMPQEQAEAVLKRVVSDYAASVERVGFTTDYEIYARYYVSDRDFMNELSMGRCAWKSVWPEVTGETEPWVGFWEYYEQYRQSGKDRFAQDFEKSMSALGMSQPLPDDGGPHYVNSATLAEYQLRQVKEAQ